MGGDQSCVKSIKMFYVPVVEFCRILPYVFHIYFNLALLCDCLRLLHRQMVVVGPSQRADSSYMYI